MIPKVISFYTPNTPYQQEVETLKRSCERFGIPICVSEVASKGSWEKNVAMKPEFILQKRKSQAGPLLWVDADGAFLQKPDFSLFEGVDFAVRFMAIFQEKPEHAINAATIFIADTDAAKELVSAWAKRATTLQDSENPPPFVDQIALYDVLLENKEAKVLPLPISYCKIYDIDQFFIDDHQVVIEQRQASRVYR